MKNLDFSKFKKVSQDKGSAVLKHADGHEFKVALNGLSGALKKELADMPLHQAEPEQPVVAIDPESPEEIIDLPEGEIVDEATPVAEPVAAAPQPAPTPAQAGAPALVPQAAPAAAPAPQAPVAAAPVEAPKPAPQAPAAPPAPVVKTPEQEAQELTNHNLAFSEDLRFGKITPKTYSDLYAEKSTLGKIGTIFGMMLSGAGSGLSHQPNALLAMMDKQIERDLEAQKQNQSNKQSWYRAALEHEKLLPENALRWGHAAEAASKADFEKWKNVQAGVTDMSATNNALNMQRAATVQSMQNIINTMPPGPQRDGAQAQLDGVIGPYFLNKAAESNLDTSKKKATANTLNPVPTAKANPPPKGEAPSGSKYDVVNENKLNSMIQKGKFAPEALDAIPPQLLGEVNREKADLTVNRNNLADAVDSFDSLSKLKNAGQVPAAAALAGAGAFLGSIAGALKGGPTGSAIAGGLGKLTGSAAGETLQSYFERNRAIQVEALKSRLGGNMSEEDKNKLAASLLPSWTDTPESMAEAHRKMIQHFESNAAETAPNLSRYGLKYPMPHYRFKAPKKEVEQRAPSHAKPNKKGSDSGSSSRDSLIDEDRRFE